MVTINKFPKLEDSKFRISFGVHHRDEQAALSLLVVALYLLSSLSTLQFQSSFSPSDHLCLSFSHFVFNAGFSSKTSFTALSSLTGSLVRTELLFRGLSNFCQNVKVMRITTQHRHTHTHTITILFFSLQRLFSNSDIQTYKETKRPVKSFATRLQFV